MGQSTLSSKISKEAQTETALPALRSSLWISLEQLCDNNCVILLNKEKMYAIKEDEVLLQGKRNIIDSLWDIPIHTIIIQEDHYEEPQRHGLTYKKQKNNFIKQCISTEKPKKEENIFSHFWWFEYNYRCEWMWNLME